MHSPYTMLVLDTLRLMDTGKLVSVCTSCFLFCPHALILLTAQVTCSCGWCTMAQLCIHAPGFKAPCVLCSVPCANCCFEHRCRKNAYHRVGSRHPKRSHPHRLPSCSSHQSALRPNAPRHCTQHHCRLQANAALPSEASAGLELWASPFQPWV